MLPVTNMRPERRRFMSGRKACSICTIPTKFTSSTEPTASAECTSIGPCRPRPALQTRGRGLTPVTPALPSDPAGPVLPEPQDTLVWTQERGGSPSTSTRPSVTWALAAATDSASCTSSCNVFREPGGHPWDPAASHSGPCALRSRKVAYTGGWGQDEGLNVLLKFPRCPGTRAAPLPPPPLPLKLREGSAARRRARCRPMPEEQPVMSTTVWSMGRECGSGSGLRRR